MRRLTFVLLLGLVTFSLTSAAQAAGPEWHLESTANTTVAPEEGLEYLVYLDNTGGDSSSGEYNIVAQLPKRMVAKEASLFDLGTNTSIPCHAGDGVSPVNEASSVKCSGTDAVLPVTEAPTQGFRTLHLKVEATAGSSGTLTATFAAFGGGSPTAEILDPTRVSEELTPFGIDAFDTEVAEESGEVSTVAGAHPARDLTNFEFNLHTKPDPLNGPRWPVAPVRNIDVDLPPGLLGNPSLIAQCTLQQLINGKEFTSQPTCPPAAQVGLVWLRTKGAAPQGTELDPVGSDFPVALYNLVPGPGTPARFGFDILGTSVVLDAKVRSGGDYGVSIVSEPPAALVIQGDQVEFWGDPAAPAHDPMRSCPGEYPSPSGPTAPAGCPADYTRPEHQAFLRNPTSCTAEGEGLTTRMHADSWFQPGAWVEKSIISHEAPGYPLPYEPTEPSDFPAGYSGPTAWGPMAEIKECENEPFKPAFTATPTTEEADSPTGLNVSISMPQEGLTEATATSESDLKKTVVTLPEGMTVNPADAGGRQACTAAQIGFKPGSSHPYEFDEAPQSCPDAAKIGTVELESPLLKEGEGGPDRVLKGAVYLATQMDNPFGSLLAMYLVVEDEQAGVTLKLPGHVIANEQTGQLETIFDENPQLPFEALRLHLFGGSRGVLKTPPTCGTYETDAVLTGWSGAVTEVEKTPFTLDKGPGGGPCPNGAFDPKLEAGTQNPLAGQASPFSLRVTREDGTQELGALTASLPPGLSGYLKGIPYCPDATLAAISGDPGTGAAQEADPSCPAASRVGTVTVGAGAGPDPFFTQAGRAYLAGPYKGAPLSLAVVAPAVAGPFDLGNVVVRNALQVNPETAQITAVSDPLPSILHGIPLDLRDLRVELDRSHFTLNPTSCEPMQIGSQITSTGGATASPSVRFQAADCATLPFKPKLSIRLEGKTARAGHPGLTATLTMPEGDADVARATVSLPHSEFLAQSHIAGVCTRVQYAEGGGGGGGCPKSSVYGHAVAYTPLLEAPLEGNVYLRSNGGERELPDLVASLNGQIHIDLVGYVGSNKKTGGLKTSFATAPDAPVSRFVLSLPAGKRSLLENHTDICQGTHKAIARFGAHSGKVAGSRVKLKAGGCAKSSKRGAHHHRRR